jgi:hypothetical protein
MKTLKSACQLYLAKIFLCLIVLSTAGCNDSFLVEPSQPDSVNNEETVQLNGILNQLDFGSGIVIVQKDGSIQEAVDASMPGGSVYIEPGIYKEAVTIHKPGIKLIGLRSSANETVILENPGIAEKGINVVPDGNNVEILNIQLRNFKEESTCISQLKCNKDGMSSPLLKMTRDELGNGIAHYQYEVKLGNREFDAVRIHRVVHEKRPYHPVPIQGDIFMVHGGNQDFNDIYLTAGAENINAETSLPVYLATKNIDVWGIDLAWTLVPEETSDFTFMKDWGIERDINHTLSAMTIARLIRGYSIRNFNRMNLLGFCYSVKIAYGAAGRETQLPKIARNVKGIIPVDAEMKFSASDEEYRLNLCNIAAAIKSQIDNGIYQDNSGLTLAYLGNLAITAPDDPSPVPDFAGLTNYQVMLFMGTMSYQAGNNFAPYWHYFGGDMSGFYYSDMDRFLRLAVSMAHYQPMQSYYDWAACACNEEDVSFDNHLDDITIPVFYLGAGGAMGSLGEFSTSLTASTDITHYIVNIPDAEREFDYGHADLFLGQQADELVWEVLQNWLIDHATER